MPPGPDHHGDPRLVPRSPGAALCPARGGRRLRPLHPTTMGAPRWGWWRHQGPPGRRSGREGGGQRVGGMGRHPGRARRAEPVGRREASRRRHSIATGISVIVHPRNPHAPAFHANLRHFVTDAILVVRWRARPDPCYLYPEDAGISTGRVRRVCDRHSVADHVAWKQACDDYFRLPHRGEARGVGGIFFDHLTEAPAEVWAFQRDLGDHLADAYLPILERRMGTPFGRRGGAVAAEAPGSLRRVQPGVGPGYQVRPGDRGPHREHPRLAPAPGPLGPRTGATPGAAEAEAARAAHRAATGLAGVTAELNSAIRRSRAPGFRLAVEPVPGSVARQPTCPSSPT